MSHGLLTLHSHSGLERKLELPKHIVLVDAKFKDMFAGCIDVKRFMYNNIEYYKVPISSFVHKGGVFKNLDE